MALVRWDPWNEMRAFTRRMERFFEPFNVMAAPEMSLPEMMGGPMVWPLVDIYEDREEMVIRAEMPGMERKDIELVVDRNVLTLRGERKMEHEDKRENYHRMECTYGKFMRSFTMPPSADVEHARAEMKNGVLMVHVPMLKGVQGKAVTIAG